jgi:hypothetical protein
MSLIMLIYCIADYKNPIYSIVQLATIGGANIFNSTLILLQVLNPSNLIKLPIFIFVAAIALALIISLAFSGYFSVVSGTLGNNGQVRGKFFAGIKRYFTKTFVISFITILLGFVILAGLGVSVVPAITITSASLAGKPEMFIPAILLDMLTFLIIFFISMFFRIYFFLWYPSSFENDKRAFRIGKRAGDTYFWPILIRLFAFDVVYAAFIAANFVLVEYKTGSSIISIIIFIANWIFRTIFFSAFVTFFFSVYKSYALRQSMR